MQMVRIITYKEEETLLKNATVSVRLDKGTLEIWNGFSWDSLPLTDIKVVATWEETK